MHIDKSTAIIDNYNQNITAYIKRHSFQRRSSSSSSTNHKEMEHITITTNSSSGSLSSLSVPCSTASSIRSRSRSRSRSSSPTANGNIKRSKTSRFARIKKNSGNNNNSSNNNLGVIPPAVAVAVTSHNTNHSMPMHHPMPAAPQAVANGMMMPALPTGMIPFMMIPTNMFTHPTHTTPLTLPTPPNHHHHHLVSPSPPPGEKSHLELFVGNTPSDASSELLISFLNGALRRTNLCPPDHTPIVGCRVSDKFSFVECASANDATVALHLNGIPFMGVNLRISRPSKYVGPRGTMKTWQDIAGWQMVGIGEGLGSVGGQQQSQGGLFNAAAVDDKVNRELFVGNTTVEMTEGGLMQFLGEAMIRTKLAMGPGNPITSCQISGKFGFIELRSTEETRRALNLNNIPYKGVYLKVSRPSKYAGPPAPCQTWQELTGEPILLNQNTCPEIKSSRELFVGNITQEMTEQSLSSFLESAMRQVGLTTEGDGNVIAGCRICGKFAFVNFRSVEETNNALNLNNIPFMGIKLKVRRAAKYTGPQTPSQNWEDVLQKYMMQELRSLPSQASMNVPKEIATKDVPDSHMSGATRVLEVTSMLTMEDIESDDDYDEVLQDTKDECSKFGTLKHVIIPRKGIAATKIYLEYATDDDASKAMKELGKRTFDGQNVTVKYCDESYYMEKIRK